MSAPERIWIDPTGITEGHTDDPAEVNDRDVEYVRRDTTHTDADLERAVRAALEAAVEAARLISKTHDAIGATWKPGDPVDKSIHEIASAVAGNVQSAIHALDPASIVASVKRGEGE